MLIQFHGSEYEWFGGFKSDLLGGINDATGTVVGAEFFIGEKSLHCMKVIKDIIETKGVPHAFYLFGKDDRDQSSTQIGRPLNELGSDIILANSPQAKGKIERLWNTFQDRLIAELKFYNINSGEYGGSGKSEILSGIFNASVVCQLALSRIIIARNPSSTFLDISSR
jgi:hypothetical protein